jgi:hypothetical protein
VIGRRGKWVAIIPVDAPNRAVVGSADRVGAMVPPAAKTQPWGCINRARYATITRAGSREVVTSPLRRAMLHEKRRGSIMNEIIDGWYEHKARMVRVGGRALKLREWIKRARRLDARAWRVEQVR